MAYFWVCDFCMGAVCEYMVGFIRVCIWCGVVWCKWRVVLGLVCTLGGGLMVL